MPPRGDPGRRHCLQGNVPPAVLDTHALGQQDTADWGFILTYFLGIVLSVLMYSDTSSRKTVGLDAFLIPIPAS